jgi:hypothetical protein
MNQLTGKKRREGRMTFTCTSLFFAEFVDEDDDAEGMDGLRGDEESVVIVHSEAYEDESEDRCKHGEEGLHLRRLPLEPGHDNTRRIPRSPSRIHGACGDGRGAQERKKKQSKKETDARVESMASPAKSTCLGSVCQGMYL